MKPDPATVKANSAVLLNRAKCQEATRAAGAATMAAMGPAALRPLRLAPPVVPAAITAEGMASLTAAIVAKVATTEPSENSKLIFPRPGKVLFYRAFFYVETALDNLAFSHAPVRAPLDRSALFYGPDGPSRRRCRGLLLLQPALTGSAFSQR